MNRILSKFCLLGLLHLVYLLLTTVACDPGPEQGKGIGKVSIPPAALATEALLQRADTYLLQVPIPLTTATSERSAGGPHDFYSEGDYWWPNPEDPDGPYLRKDGQTNPDNFTDHRKAMRQLNKWVSTLVAAYKLTGDERYAAHALIHLNAFFLTPETLMNPSLLYAQAIKGKVTGRGIGIIDTIHLIEVAKAIEMLAASGYLKGPKLVGLKNWFAAYATWLTTHEYGLKEKDHGNNHSTWWAAQIAAFGHLTENEDLLNTARSQYKKLLNEQMAADGSFPDELDRTKPYNYSLFNLEAYSILCSLASTEADDLWTYESKHGTLRQAWAFMLPYMRDKSAWPKEPDVQHFEELPLQTPGHMLAALAYEDADMLAVWRALDPARKSEEMNRTFAIREPLLWLP